MSVLDKLFGKKKKREEIIYNPRAKIMRSLRSQREMLLGKIIKDTGLSKRIILRHLEQLIKIKRVTYREDKVRLKNNTIRARLYSLTYNRLCDKHT